MDVHHSNSEINILRTTETHMLTCYRSFERVTRTLCHAVFLVLTDPDTCAVLPGISPVR
jgi:hypothetical protein